MKVYCIFYTHYDNSCLAYLYLNEENVKKKIEELNLNEETDNYHYRILTIEIKLLILTLNTTVFTMKRLWLNNYG